MPDKFTLDKQLAAESIFAAALPLCDVRLMREQRWFWLLLVPRIKGVTEIFDLSAAQRAQSVEEINFAARQLQRAATPCDKINIGALGNIVRQLHVHIIARVKGDAGWPGPVWGQGVRQDLQPASQAARLAAIQALLTAGAGGNMGSKLQNLLP